MTEPQFRHPLVQELWNLLHDWIKPNDGNPLLSAIWVGIRGTLPELFQQLDENEGIVEEIRRKLAKVVGVQVVDVEAPPTESKSGEEC
mgnify:CR=1 FL=1